MQRKRPVAVVTGFTDVTADLVVAELNRRAVPVIRFDPADLGTGLMVSARINGGRISGELKTPERTLDLEQVRSVYWRRPGKPTYPGLSTQDARFAAAQANTGLRSVLRNLSGCLYVNHPREEARADDKAAQLRVAEELGMRVPDTLLTNSLEDAQEFAAEHRKPGGVQAAAPHRLRDRR